MQVSMRHHYNVVLSDPLQVQLLQMVCKMIGAKKAIDIGKQVFQFIDVPPTWGLDYCVKSMLN